MIVKLDVEGAEAQAVRGARDALHAGAILLYEDHGSDRECKATEAVLDMGLRVFALDPHKLSRLHTVADVRTRKSNAHSGYNFVAVRDERRLGL